MSSEASTPLMRQYHSIKQQVPGALLMFRLGDFYELFYEDAVTAARELEITLTSRNKEKGQAIPMCGVPFHAAEGYIARLIQRGYRVAICDQMEDARFAKKLVKRELTRVVTPGTVTETGLLRSHENNYLAAVALVGKRAGLAHVDVSTGEFRTTELEEHEVAAAIEHLGAREVLCPSGSTLDGVSALRTEVDGWVFTPDHAERSLREHYHLLSLDGCGLAERPLAVGAAGAVLHYLKETQKSTLDHIDRPSYYDRAAAMILDSVTVRNLELLEPIFPADLGGRKDACLLDVMDETLTGMGGRLLRSRLLRPSMQLEEIESRLEAVEDLFRDTIRRSELRKVLSQILDLERLLAKITLGSATPREVLGLGRSLQKVPELSGKWGKGSLDAVEEVAGRILAAISDEPPANIADGGTIRSGFHPELDELRDLSRNSRQYVAQVETRERARTGIQSLKVRFNNIFGYYIEVSKSNLHLVPDEFERKQTLVNAERYTTPELKELERKILAAEEKILDLEKGNIRRGARLRRFARIADSRNGRRHRRSRRNSRAGAGSGREPLDSTALLRRWRDANRRRAPSGDREARRTRSVAVHPERSVSLRVRLHRHHHRAEHGRQVHLSQAGGAHCRDGADGLLRARRVGAAAGARPRVHPHRRVGQPGARPLDLHGGDDRDGRHPQHGDGAQPDCAR